MSPSSRNAAVAAELAEIAALLSARRTERFRVRAFRNAGRLVASLPLDVAALTAEERRRLDGVGPAVDRVIGEHLVDGVSAYLLKLRADEPPGFGVLVQVMGISARVARTLSARGVQDLAGLAAAVADGSIASIDGVGPRTVEVIADGLGRVDLAARGGMVLREARLEAQQWARELGRLPDVEQVKVAGAVRRGVAQPKELELLTVARADPDAVATSIAGMTNVLRTLGRTDPVGRRIELLTARGRRLVVHLTDAARAGSGLVRATGSAAHVERLRALGMPDDAPDESRAYAVVGLSVVPPPLRELAAPPVPDRLVELADLRGDGHVHTEWSGDGHDSIEELARAGIARGYDWLALTDHAENLTMNGLSREDLARRDTAIAEVQRRHPEIALLRGLELNIGVDGRLDYDLETLLGQDWCVASVHSLFQRPATVQTDRILAAIAHPAVDAIGHPVGRMLGVRAGYEIDIWAIAQAAAETGTALEVNGSPRRLDLDAQMVAIAVRAGAPIVLSSDAHRARELDHVVESVLTAQRGGCPVELVRNAGAVPRRARPG